MRDMMSTEEKKLQKKFAAAARELAEECLAGTAPKLGAWYESDEPGGPVCAIGTICRRLGVLSETTLSHEQRELISTANGYDLFADSDNSFDGMTDKQRQDRLVFPLLAVADELEAPDE